MNRKDVVAVISECNYRGLSGARMCWQVKITVPGGTFVFGGDLDNARAANWLADRIRKWAKVDAE